VQITAIGEHVNREEAIALLKQIAESNRFSFNWISLVTGKAGCEIHIKSDDGNPDVLKLIFEKLGLDLKEVKGVLVIYRTHDTTSDLPENY